jgi:tripartite-type tricarboxylate transporter receptor subunit TctC
VPEISREQPEQVETNQAEAEVIVKSKKGALGFSARLFLLALSTYLLPGNLFGQSSFFQGKTVTVIQGRDPGGTGDLRVKALFPFLQKYIPGNPTIVSEYMPGGGSRKAANHIFRTARPDGLTIGNFSSAMVSMAILGESGVLP